MNQRDRRRHPRYEAIFRVDLLNMGDDPMVSPFEAIVPAQAVDVSLQGMQVKAAYNAPVGAFLSVILYSDGGESVCLCEVVWKRETGGQMLYGCFTKEWSKMNPKLAKILDGIADGESIASHGRSGFSSIQTA